MAESKKEPIYTPKKTVKYFIFSFVTLWIACMIIWPIIDLIFSKISNEAYVWNPVAGIVTPGIVSLIVTIIEFAFWNFFHGGSKKK